MYKASKVFITFYVLSRARELLILQKYMFVFDSLTHFVWRGKNAHQSFIYKLCRQIMNLSNLRRDIFVIAPIKKKKKTYF